MKIHLLLLTGILMMFSGNLWSQAQAENGGFEKWDTLAYDPDHNVLIVEPNKWSSLKTADNLADVAPDVCFLSEDAHSGSYSVHLKNISSFGTVANGILTCGRVHAEVEKEKAYTFTDPDHWDWHMRLSGRPDSVAGWFKYVSADGDFGTFNFDLHTGFFKKPATAEDSAQLVGSAYFETPKSTVSTWTRFCVPFEYFKDTTPEFILITISSGDSYNAKAGSEMWVDDLEMIYNEGNTTSVKKHPAPQGDLQTWFAGGILHVLLKTSGHETYRLSVTDMTGRRIYNGTIVPNDRQLISLNAEKGIYIVHISNGQTSYVKKVFAE